MFKWFAFSFVIVYVCKCAASSNLPGPLVYVVTPSPRPPHVDEGRAAPFYYHNWMRRMDSPPNMTTTTTTPKTKTPDLIFAEFESGDNMKSIRKLLEREKVVPKPSTTTTSKPIYMQDAMSNVSQDKKVPMTMKTNVKNQGEAKPVDMTDYFALYNNWYNPNSADQAPVYKPSTAPPSTTTTTSTTTSPNVENVWHIIDSQKYDQYPGQWEEETVPGEQDKPQSSKPKPQIGDKMKKDNDDQDTDNNYSLPGFVPNAESGAENESRAIHSDQNLRFPYINLKPFQMKTQNKPQLNTISESKKGKNEYTSLDNFYEIKNPVRGEAEDVVPKSRPPIDRYNPAQPYLPDYGNKKQSNAPSSPPAQVVANLVPPPPPPPPRVTANDFPAPSSYESFPPYITSDIQPPPAPQAPAPEPALTYEPPEDSSDDSDTDTSSNDNDSPVLDLGYRYKQPPPPPPVQPPPPPPKPYNGYTYDKPPVDDSPPDDKDYKVEPQGYFYNKPTVAPVYYPPPSYGYPKYHYHAPTTTTTTETPRVNRYSYYYLGKKLYYLPLYFSVYFIVYVGALIIKAVLRHKIVYPNSWRPNDQTASYFSKRSIDFWDSNENLHEMTGRVTKAIAEAGEKYFSKKNNK